MSVNDTEPKVEDLEREVDQSRAQVSHTLDELQSQVSETIDQWRSRLTAEEITKELKSYASGYVSSLGSRITTRVRENPASAVAVAAAAAWPVYKVARSIPVPVYLMGAGVALMKPLGRAWEHGREAFQDLTPPRGQSDRYEEVAHGRGAVSGVHSGTSSSAMGGTDEVRTSTTGSFTDGARQAYETAAGMAAGIPDRASAAAARAMDMSRRASANPIVLGVLGAAATAALAASLPRRRKPARPDRHYSPPAQPDQGFQGARAAVLRAYGVARREALAEGATVTEADAIARAFIMRMSGRGNEAPASHAHREDWRAGREATAGSDIE